MADITLDCPICLKPFLVKLTLGELQGPWFPVQLRSGELMAAWLEHALAQGESRV